MVNDIDFSQVPRVLSEKLNALGNPTRVDFVTPCEIDIYASSCGFDNKQTGVESTVEGFFKFPKEYANASALLLNSKRRCVGLLHLTDGSGRPLNAESAFKRMTVSAP